jgi:hypothetical protein
MFATSRIVAVFPSCASWSTACPASASRYRVGARAKGACVALTLFNDFGDLSKLIDLDIQLQFKSAIQKIKKLPIFALMFTKAAQNIIKEQYDRVENNPKFIELFLFKLRAFTQELISEGVNIDTMSKRDFRIIIANKMSSWMEE